MIRILIADDHQIFIDGIRALLEQDIEMEIVGEALNGRQALTILDSIIADIVIMDINMPELDGIATTEMITKQFPNVNILMLTMYEQAEYIKVMLEKGAKGYLLKNTTKKELLLAVRAVANGRTYYSKEVTDKVMGSYQEPSKDKASGQAVHITRRETEVLSLIAKENTTKNIADKLFISKHTVETHRKNLLSKIGAKNTAGLVKFAVENGLTD